MPFYVKDAETDAMVRELAKRDNVAITEAVKRAVSAELKRGKADEARMRAEVRKIQDRIARYPKTGLKADKAFFDEMSGD